jgi:hypothetical protein
MINELIYLYEQAGNPGKAGELKELEEELG